MRVLRFMVAAFLIPLHSVKVQSAEYPSTVLSPTSDIHPFTDANNTPRPNNKPIFENVIDELLQENEIIETTKTPWQEEMSNLLNKIRAFKSIETVNESNLRKLLQNVGKYYSRVAQHRQIEQQSYDLEEEIRNFIANASPSYTLSKQLYDLIGEIQNSRNAGTTSFYKTIKGVTSKFHRLITPVTGLSHLLESNLVDKLIKYLTDNPKQLKKLKEILDNVSDEDYSDIYDWLCVVFGC